MRRLLLLFLAILIAAGCAAPTKPNVSALYGMPELRSKLPPQNGTSTDVVLPHKAQALFRELYSQDSGLALEVGKLPEFQGPIGEKTLVALERFTRLVQIATQAQKSNLVLLLDEGKPSVRRYCAPLQAIFWILEKSDLDDILGWPLVKILTEAWYSTGFEMDAPQRWQSFSLVTERLNSPSLADFYVRRNFSYRSRLGGKYFGSSSSFGTGSAYQIFSSRIGNCEDFTAFYVYCLRKAGYEVNKVSTSLWGRVYDNVICEFIDKDGIKYVIDSHRALSPGGTGITTADTYYGASPKIGDSPR